MFASFLRFVTLLAILCLALAVRPAPASAQWVEDGVDIAYAAQTPFYHQLCSDGEGGAIMVRARSGRVYADRIDAHGRVLWTADGVDISSASGYFGSPVLAADGQGGAFVAFLRNYGGENDIWAQRIDADGTLLWGAEGDSICSAINDQEQPDIVADGVGGAIIVWRDERGSTMDIYAQRVDGTGTVQWTADGEAVCTATGDQITPRIVTDGAMGAIIAWLDDRDGWDTDDVYAQHVWYTGSMHWTADGVPLSSDSYPQLELQLVADGGGGAIAAWKHHFSGDYIHAGRIGHYGTLAWAMDGVRLSDVSGGQSHPALVPDGTGGAIVTWQDRRNSTDGDIYAQHIDGAGAVQWGASALAVCTATGYQDRPGIVTDGSGGAILTWEDRRVTYGDVYAQRVDAGGSVIWTADGTPLCTQTERQEEPEIVSDGEGGAVVIWRDMRGQVTHAYGQRVERNGYWGYPSGVILSCNDVPGDQGGLVNLAWYASRLDPWPDMLISHYTLWRAIESAPSGPYTLLSDPGLALAAADERVGPVIRVEETAGQTFFWELVDTQDAYHLASYSKTIPTLFDSTDVTDRYHYFQVMAHGVNAGEFWISPPDSGRSVDNLAPAAPQALAGTVMLDPNGIDLGWAANDEEDLSHYEVYRGLAPDFVADAGSFVATTEDTTAFDPGGYGDLFYYKLFAVDVHGNRSPFALLEPLETTGVGDDRPAAVTRLAQNVPNPFPARGTRIAFSLREPGEVSLRVFDATGRLVRVLAEGPWPAGAHALDWDGRDLRGRAVASGVYYYRLDAPAFTQTRRMVLLR